MKIELTKFLSSISFALDYVENEFLQTLMKNAGVEFQNLTQSDMVYVKAECTMQPHVSPFHSKRVAVLTNRMAAGMNMPGGEVYALTHAALLHDFALSDELTKYQKGENDIAEGILKSHCRAGEKIMSGLPFYEEIRSDVLFHHEQADGRGPYGKRADEIPFGAELIHIADDLDIRFSLDQMDENKYARIIDFVPRQAGTLYSEKCAEAFLTSVNYNILQSITGENSLKVLNDLIPSVKVDVSVQALRKMSLIFADITDYKSNFTWKHSLGIAEKAEAMGHYYGYTEETCDKLYIAGALHDIGKIFISNDILEKPGKLTDGEYKQIQNHALGTRKLLSGIGGMEEISSWAANHHEKLDGSGYPFGKTADELDVNSRLMACLDIYQALVEERPYKAGLSHTEAMDILNRMGSAGQLDAHILADIDMCFSKNTENKLKEAKMSEAYTAEADPQSRKPKYTKEAWKCPVCGYIYEGELPDDFICPRCEQPGSIFERVN